MQWHLRVQYCDCILWRTCTVVVRRRQPSEKYYLLASSTFPQYIWYIYTYIYISILVSLSLSLPPLGSLLISLLISCSFFACSCPSLSYWLSLLLLYWLVEQERGRYYHALPSTRQEASFWLVGSYGSWTQTSGWYPDSRRVSGIAGLHQNLVQCW